MSDYAIETVRRMQHEASLGVRRRIAEKVIPPEYVQRRQMYIDGNDNILLWHLEGSANPIAEPPQGRSSSRAESFGRS